MGTATNGDLTTLDVRIDQFEAAMSARIDRFKVVLSGKIDAVKAEMTSFKWILGVLTAAVFSLVAKAFLFT